MLGFLPFAKQHAPLPAMRTWRHAIALMLTLLLAPAVHSQTYPPGTFSIDGIPVICGGVATVMAPNLPDVGMNDLRGHIYINPSILRSQPTVLKLFWYAHECGHSVKGADETEADCWAIRTGKQQGWFSRDDFSKLTAIFENNPGDWTHLPGRERVKAIKRCYGLSDEESDSRRRRDDDPPRASRCATEYSSCIRDIRGLDACMERKQRSCISDCVENFRYPRALCEARFCNPDMGSNTRWEPECNRRIDRDKAACVATRDECRSSERR